MIYQHHCRATIASIMRNVGHTVLVATQSILHGHVMLIALYIGLVTVRISYYHLCPLHGVEVFYLGASLRSAPRSRAAQRQTSGKRAASE